MEQHRVPGPPDGGQARRGRVRRQHDLAVGVEQCQNHEGQVDPVKHAVLVVAGAVAEEQRVVTEDAAVEEGGALVEDGDEQVGDGRRCGEKQDAADQQQGAGGGEHLAVVQREADGDVALHRHPSQDERGGAGGEHGHHDLEERQQRWVRGRSSGQRARSPLGSEPPGSSRRRHGSS